MAFLKLSVDRAYATGAIRSNLPIRQLVSKLARAGLPTRVADDRLDVRSGADLWTFASWEPDGLGRIGWLEFTLGGDVGALSRRLARAGIRHRIDYSRPLDIDTSHIRCITQYDFRWNTPGLAPPSADMPSIQTFDEHI